MEWKNIEPCIRAKNFKLFYTGILANGIQATVAEDWERKYAVEQSWEGQKFYGKQ